MVSRKDKQKGVLLATVGTIFMSTYFITGKFALDREHGFNPGTFCIIWTAASSVMSLIFVVCVGQLRGIRLKKVSLPGMVGLGLTTGFGMVLLYASIRILDPSFNAFLARVLPVLVILLSAILLNERLRRMEVLPMLLMLVGGVACVWGRWPEVGTGMMMAIAAYMLLALHRVFTKQQESRGVPASVIVFYRSLLAFVVIVSWVFVSELFAPFRESPVMGVIIAQPVNFDVELKYWLVLFLGSFLGPFVANLFSYRAYHYLSLSHCMLVTMIQPLVVLPMSYVFLGMLPSRRSVMGGLVILAGAFWLVWLHMNSFRRNRSGKAVDKRGTPVSPLS